ncbi:hypothetical protein HETIRDRAFT_421556 [Heterobasidion irregulare TC 32-1]|uniref:Uncharacterized protein n=1 Tax=Heterobasidion irregulare (strain TC 32-1) TaxID=747525 RepID=W4JWG4_HETIT|nr:uncharacterized protein HETIRDRAFT_421556 [Heterobasidion irregulare TC 32-1]ETW77430.1 hypothetical protein HETIRDRAFT_421556 [Heterobasidion irregulare TC 32-1]
MLYSPALNRRQVSENRQSGNPQANKETLSRWQVPADRQSGDFQAKEGHHVDKPMRRSQRSINPHPANSAGLFKRTRAEVAKSAQAKRSAKASVVQAKSQSTEAAKKSEAEGIKKLAQLEDQRRREDRAEEAYLNASVDERDRNEDIPATDGLVEANNLTAMDVDDSIHDRKISYQRHIHEDEEDGGIVSDDMDVMDGSTKSPASSKKHRTQAEKRKARAAEVRLSVSAVREVARAPKRTLLTAELSNLSAPARKKSKGAQHSALEADWREKVSSKLKGHTATSPSLHSKTPSCMLLPSTLIQQARRTPSVPQATIRRIKPRISRSEERNIDSEEGSPDSDIEGGFTDVNVATPKEDAMKAKASTRKLNTVVVALNEDETPVDMNALRRPRSQVGPAKSLSKSQLPEWAKKHWDSKIIPTLLDFYGIQDDPWNLDGDDGVTLFRTALQQTINLVCPGIKYTPMPVRDKVYLIARQAVYDWHRRFQTKAIQAVKSTVASLGNKNTVKAFVQKALQPKYGAAYWATPDPERPEGAMQSIYIVKVLAMHVKSTQGSIFTQKYYPVGSLCLAVLAVKRAFLAYSTGSFKPLNTSFSEEHCGTKTQDLRQGLTIRTFLKKPHRQDELAERISRYLANGDDIEDRGFDDDENAIVDRSSPPPSNDEHDLLDDDRLNDSDDRYAEDDGMNNDYEDNEDCLDRTQCGETDEDDYDDA